MKENKGKTEEFDWNTKEKRQLVSAFLSIVTEDEAKKFLRDLMTPVEIMEFTNRLEAARLLSRDVKYNPIIEKTGLSSTTVARISRWLKGPLGGYRIVLDRLNHHTYSSKFLGKGLSSHS